MNAGMHDSSDGALSTGPHCSSSVGHSVMPNSLQPTDCSPSGSSVCGILQARIPEQVAIPFSRGSSQPRDQTQVSSVVGRFLTVWATREAHIALQAVSKQFRSRVPENPLIPFRSFLFLCSSDPWMPLWLPCYLYNLSCRYKSVSQS